MRIPVKQLVSIAHQVGQIATRYHQIGVQTKIKADHTPVTEADILINKEIVDWIEENYPQVRVIGEEQCGGASESDYILLVDPIDGTIPFTAGMKVSAVVLTLMYKLQPISAVIYDPFEKRAWYAEEKDNQIVSKLVLFGDHNYGDVPGVSRQASLVDTVSSVDAIKNSHVLSCWWQETISLSGLEQALKAQHAKVVSISSVAYFGGLIASGGLEASVFVGTDTWETAAMELIVRGAGGKATDFDGRPLEYWWEGDDLKTSPHVISNGHIHDELLNLINQSVKK